MNKYTVEDFVRMYNRFYRKKLPLTKLTNDNRIVRMINKLIVVLDKNKIDVLSYIEFHSSIKTKMYRFTDTSNLFKYKQFEDDNRYRFKTKLVEIENILRLDSVNFNTVLKNKKTTDSISDILHMLVKTNLVSNYFLCLFNIFNDKEVKEGWDNDKELRELIESFRKRI